MDWWALGILVYEMIVGFPPFYTGLQDNSKMYELIKSKPVRFPNFKQHGIGMSPEAENFITHLLQKDPQKRLGSKGGLAEIVAHPWFSDISADQLINKQIKPDFKPKLSKNILDVSNFD